MNGTPPKIWIPGGDDLIHAGTARIWDYWEVKHAERAKRAPRPDSWREQSVATQVAWMRPQRAFAEMVVIALITDQREVMAGYDQIMGGAFDRAVLKYSMEELNFNPLPRHLNGEHP